MKVERTIKIDVNTFKVGDIIKFKLTDGTKMKAIAVQKDAGGIFALQDRQSASLPMSRELLQ